MHVVIFEDFYPEALAAEVNIELENLEKEGTEVVSIAFSQTIGTMNEREPDNLRPLTTCFIVTK